MVKGYIVVFENGRRLVKVGELQELLRVNVGQVLMLDYVLA